MMADANVLPAVRGWVLYDDACGFCRRAAVALSGFLRRRGYDVLPLQTEGMAARLRIPAERLLDELRVLTRGGEVYGGARAVLFLLRLAWWGKPLAWAGSTAWGYSFVDFLYKQVARRRQCRVPPKPPL